MLLLQVGDPSEPAASPGTGWGHPPSRPRPCSHPLLVPFLTWHKWCLLGPSVALGQRRKRCSSAVRIFSFLPTLERMKRNRIFSP